MSEHQHALGLTHNPFAEPGGDFFDRGDRRSCLEQLRQLSQWSRRVQLVTGPPGAGKTMLFRHLSAGLEPRAKAARINAALINAPREVLAAVVQGFGLAAPADAHSQLLLDVIIAHVEDQQSHQRFCAILVDNAELLDARAIEQLLTLVNRCLIRLVLFAEVRIVQLVERAARQQDLTWHEFRLSGLSQNEVRDYLEWRFKQARYRGRLPFTDQQVRDIARLSEGMPGRIDQMANALLTKLQTGEPEPGRAGFPVLHRAIIGVLVVLLLLAYLLLRSPEEASPPDVAQQTPATEVIERRAAVQDEPVSAVPEKGPTASATGVADRASEAAPEKVGKPSVGIPVEPSTEKSPPPVTETPAVARPKTAPVANNVVDEAATTGPKSAQWILGQPADHFTLQLLTSSSAERATAYVAGRKRQQDFAIYRIRRNDRVLYVVVYGSFSRQQDAERAALTSEATAGGVKPWVRRFREVQEALRTTPQT